MKTFKICLILAFAIAAVPRAVLGGQVVNESDMYYDKDKGERVVKGLHFSVAEDRAMEKSGQYYEPEGLDKYFKKKFDKVYGMLDEMMKKMSDLEAKIAALEEEVKGLKMTNPLTLVDTEDNPIVQPAK